MRPSAHIEVDEGDLVSRAFADALRARMAASGRMPPTNAILRGRALELVRTKTRIGSFVERAISRAPGAKVLDGTSFAGFAPSQIPTVAERVAFFRGLRENGVDEIVIAERDAGHNIDDLLSRFRNARRHYRALADLISASLPAADADLVHREVLVPEIYNIVTKDGKQREHRHEPIAAWESHLEAAGFRIENADRLLHDEVPIIGVIRASVPGF